MNRTIHERLSVQSFAVKLASCSSHVHDEGIDRLHSCRHCIHKNRLTHADTCVCAVRRHVSFSVFCEAWCRGGGPASFCDVRCLGTTRGQEFRVCHSAIPLYARGRRTKQILLPIQHGDGKHTGKERDLVGGCPLLRSLGTSLRENFDRGASLVSRKKKPSTQWRLPGILSSAESHAPAGLALFTLGRPRTSQCSELSRELGEEQEEISFA